MPELHHDINGEPPERSDIDGTIRSVIGPTARYKKVWTARQPLLVQDGMGTLGYGLVSLLCSAPHKWKLEQIDALGIYSHAAALDDTTNVSLSSIMKAGIKLGYFDDYLWAENVDDIIDCVVRKGPLLTVIPWHNSMFVPDRVHGVLTVEGPSTGTNALVISGYWPRHPYLGDVLIVTSTWGHGWGLRGYAYITVKDMEELFEGTRQAVVPHNVRLYIPPMEKE